MLDGPTQLTAMFGAPERKAPQPPAPVVTPPGSRSKRKWAPANAIPPLALPPLKSPKKAVPPGWMRYGLAPALRRCDECGDDVVGVNRADICRGKRGCQALVCDACHVQSRRGQLRAIALRRVAIISSRRRLVDGVQAPLDLRRAARDPARHAVEQMTGTTSRRWCTSFDSTQAPRLRDALTTTRGRDVFVEAGLVDEEWSSGRVCEPCLARLEARLDEFEDTPCPTPRAE